MDSLQKLQVILQNSASNVNHIRLQGEEELRIFQQDSSYPLHLLQYISHLQIQDEFKLRASIEFKRWCEKYRNIDESEVQNFGIVISSIKQSIVPIMMESNYKTYQQLVLGFQFLASKEFPYRWQNLVNELIQYLSQSDPQKLLKCLKALYLVVKRYDYESRSDPLYEEIILVCNEAHDALFTIARSLIQQIQVQNDPIYFKLLKCALKIFHCLNFQDLHPKFEDNLNNWMQILVESIKLENNVLTGQNQDQFIIFKCKGEALRCVLLYSRKYREDIESLIEGFSQEIWQICTKTNTDPKYDKIVMNALKYYRDLVCWDKMNQFFSQNMEILLNSLVFNNLGVSEQDSSMYYEESESFITTYFESSDVTSRRNQTNQLLKTVARNYTHQVTEVIKNLILQTIQSIQAQGQNIQGEITLINILIDGLTVNFRPKDGVSKISLSKELLTYFYQNILQPFLMKIQQPIMNGQIKQFSGLYITYYLRFLFYYRHYVPREDLGQIIKTICYLLQTSDDSLRMATYYTIDSLINIEDGDLLSYQKLQPYFNEDSIQTFIQFVLENIYYATKKNDLETHCLNCLMNIVKKLKSRVIQYCEAFTDLYNNLIIKLTQTYTFEHARLVFEGLALLLDQVANTNQFEFQKIGDILVPSLNQVINNNQRDLIGFVLQIYGIIVKGNQQQTDSNYITIYQSIVNQQNWVQDNLSLFPAYVSFLKCYVQKQREVLLIDADKFQFISRVLLEFKEDIIFFDLMESIVSVLSLQELVQSNHLSSFLSTYFNYYNISINTNEINFQTQIFKQGLIRGFYMFVLELLQIYDPRQFMEEVNKISNGMITQFIISEIDYLKNVQKYIERRPIFIGMKILLLDSISQMPLDHWSIIINALLDNCVSRRKSNRIKRTIFQTLQTTTHNPNSASAGFQQLSVIQKKHKKYENIADEEKYFAQCFNIFYQNPSVQQNLNIGSLLSIENQEMLTQLIQMQ